MRVRGAAAAIMALSMSVAVALGGCGASSESDKKTPEATKKVESTTAAGSTTVTESSQSQGETEKPAEVGDAKTEDIDTSTTLKDGEYKPTSFDYSGGSGRATLKCSGVTVTDGKAYANIVFDSSHYGYIKADNDIIYGTVKGDTSSFLIPIKLNANNHIYGMTNAMSTPHEIEYFVFVGVEDAAQDGMAVKTTAGDQYEELDEEAPEIATLTFDKKEEVNSKLAKIFQYKGGYKLIEVVTKFDTTDDVDKTSTPLDQQKESLYHKHVMKYLIVPEGGEVPAGTDKQVIVIQKPVDSIFLATEGIPNKVAKESARDDAKVVEGSVDSLDVKTLLLNKTKVAIVPSNIAKDKLVTLGKRGIQMDMAVFVDEFDQENAPQGWEKIYQTILGK
ncbi:MAG: hypothetical protein U0K57_06380 [Lachnospiraceae bacterium]|nr:hypothetical protein [Lachnospiraceae bacterium]